MIEKIEMMKKYLFLVLSLMMVQLSFAQVDSVEIIFKPYLIQVDQKRSTEFERIKKELELPTALYSHEERLSKILCLS